MRLANNDEELVLLDGTTAKLQPNTLVIADQTGPLAMAGILVVKLAVLMLKQQKM